MISNLKLKHDALGGKTMHDGDHVLVGCMKFLRVLGCSCSKKFSTPMSIIFKGGEGDLLINLSLFV